MGRRSFRNLPWRPPLDLIETDRGWFTLPIHLKESVRLVIGLLEMGLTPRQTAVILGARVKDLERFLRILRASRHPVIVTCMTDGLPPDCAVELPNGVLLRCKGCGQRVNKVPCPVCALHKKDPLPPPEDDPLSDRMLKKPFKTPKKPTAFLPGTDAKIEVMRERVARGECPFHPADAPLPAVRNAEAC